MRISRDRAPILSSSRRLVRSRIMMTDSSILHGAVGVRVLGLRGLPRYWEQWVYCRRGVQKKVILWVNVFIHRVCPQGDGGEKTYAAKRVHTREIPPRTPQIMPPRVKLTPIGGGGGFPQGPGGFGW